MAFETISREELLSRKTDYSDLLVHLIKEDRLKPVPAKSVLETILGEHNLRAYRHHCWFSPALDNTADLKAISKKFNVVCFTETPLNNMAILLKDVQGKVNLYKPYGLVFKKEYISDNGGNPVFYVRERGTIAPLWSLLEKDADANTCKLLALVSRSNKGFDFHWEREWRIVGDLQFDLKDIYCCICPSGEIEYFEKKFKPVTFIDPLWQEGVIRDKLEWRGID